MKAVFLDRDGVINRSIVKNGKPYPPQSLAELELYEDVPEGLRALKAAGFFLSLCTNQPDVGRGTLPQERVEEIHDFMKKELCIDEVNVCYDDGRTVNSIYRKPQPGMLTQSALKNKLMLSESYMIGDRWRDIDAGFNAGCRTIFIDWSYDEQLKAQPDYRVRSFSEAVQIILRNSTQSRGNHDRSNP